MKLKPFVARMFLFGKDVLQVVSPGECAGRPLRCYVGDKTTGIELVDNRAAVRRFLLTTPVEKQANLFENVFNQQAKIAIRFDENGKPVEIVLDDSDGHGGGVLCIALLRFRQTMFEESEWEYHTHIQVEGEIRTLRIEKVY
ncbi:hypothetical protein A2450_02455 [candidate division WWE3 bacterium RIFOXYC2_FULL_40_11]|uniref:Uncharacterized protein n=1 Tax=candidate division WWE3 bacterium RIFOXYA2_FULL_46_9 TaxID=1802636 RepID=A0A1F4W137_UNCKA|nr:MAG: hypothetical protein A2264_00295 [candidate division WWE3 bacterium RIFOXYA2_FULL_46_9]OGC64944.1 MAG: hypothetical protein A2326_02815 [candidate division WWE3 bacterium RIFOXYB2_FULL_41_6]OGC67648.1 MAG: hypothetical protein A2450_02455 [candidate division WWE3 bacterium RIFOXYC2_FULL_40_11]HLD51494.1 hypothetical protein [Patescibacteria group bacterium]